MIGVDDLRAAAARLKDAMEQEFDALNAADGKLGDGDLGVTMRSGAREVAARTDQMPDDDFGMALMNAAQAFTKVSSSSYGTLLATGLMAAAKETRGKASVEPSKVAALIAAARDKMMARGKAELGNKTVLDSLHAMVGALEGADDPAAAAVTACRDAQQAFRDKPAQIGRARIFAEKSVGMDDPGMLAMTRIVEAVTGRK
ncbi:dihydroxyacetone kinase subunit L [Jannaschia aquimarina]|uniref:DhaL protein n=1 Tax=Jannaschia aquimarina TaxID=935700 RepID=A0A0D1D4D7_9RHOB|nr:dihydroxyacetone kinase subunit L [Jannaschia aquimarina]KIT14928.1 PTS-dependent dihydroxyacetone kinase, ADP-binding subunit DhaL [Jannaschia aquimarina]SNS59589.1 dihydroxyacetone kinase, C-terminal domain [Jannaschia aquimarina]